MKVIWDIGRLETCWRSQTLWQSMPQPRRFRPSTSAHHFQLVPMICARSRLPKGCESDPISGMRCSKYRAGGQWVWDRDAKEPRLFEDGDDPSLAFTTITRENLNALRYEFSSTIEPQLAGSTADLDKLAQWRLKGLGIAALPPATQNLWSEFLRQKVLERLEGWFSSHGISTPEDIEYFVEPTSTKPVDQELEQLGHTYSTASGQ